jgi:hypothetical protein
VQLIRIRNLFCIDGFLLKDNFSVFCNILALLVVDSENLDKRIFHISLIAIIKRTENVQVMLEHRYIKILLNHVVLAYIP